MNWRSRSAMRFCVASLVIGVILVSAGDTDLRVSLGAQGKRRAGDPGRLPQLEVVAPGAFDQHARATHEHRVRYQVNATVLFPLFSIPFAHRENVGFAATAVQDFVDREGGPVRTHELFAASYPERARGLNRMGFIREAVGFGVQGPRWTAHFGALSSNPETSRQQVALDSDETVQLYTVMDGYTDSRLSWNRDVHLQLKGSWTSPELFYNTLLPVWRAKELEATNPSYRQSTPGYQEPLGFLGIVIQSLRVAAMDVRARTVPRKIRYAFAHKGEVMRLWLRGHRVDSRRQRRYVADGLVDPDVVLHRLDYEILNDDGDGVQSFRIWTELPTGRDSPRSPPIMPMAFEFKAKSFLELEAVRVSELSTY